MEFNFDGLVGPTHNYAGLSHGNVASKTNEGNIAKPKDAVLQGLGKMKALFDMGISQGVLPPQERPNVEYLRSFGFSGKDHEVIEKVSKSSPILLAVATSASSMWTANAATVSPSADTEDGKVHFSVANLSALPHRAQEHPTTYNALKSIFRDEKAFKVHKALPGGNAFGDEGAANHTRLCSSYDSKGVEIFTYGRSALNKNIPEPKIYPARQTLESSEALIRRHELREDVGVLVQQNPEVIDAGVFHNDVISVGNKNVLFYHEDAFLGTDDFLETLENRVEDFCPIKVLRSNVSVSDAVSSYLFNTQLVSLNGDMAIIAPTECEKNLRVKEEIQRIIERSDNPISKVHFFNLTESMKNGGGPACLRLRVTMTEAEQKLVNSGAIFSHDLYDRLVLWANKHYRDEIRPADICDPKLLDECRFALDELTQILKLGSIYPFQM